MGRSSSSGLTVIDIPLAETLDSLAKTFPKAGVRGPLSFLGQGFHSFAVETRDGMVYRIGRTQRAAECYRTEWSVLPTLARLLSVSIPAPLWYSRESSAFPYGVLGYRKLAGRDVDIHRLEADHKSLLGGDVARFLRSLHSQSVIRNVASRLPGGLTGAELASLRQRTLPGLKRFLSLGEWSRLDTWWDTQVTGNRDLTRYHPLVSHGDLWTAHLLLNGEPPRLTGVLDFGLIHLGDPAHGDFAPLLHAGREFVVEVLTKYFTPRVVPEALCRRIDTYWGVREFWGIDHALGVDLSQIDDSIRKLREGSILSPDDHPPLYSQVWER